MTSLLVRFLGEARTSEVKMSPGLLEELRLTSESAPRTLEQWLELCHPSDHEAARELEEILTAGGEPWASVMRRLYCGDGVYRAFRLDACLYRDEEGRLLCLMGVEHPVAAEDLVNPLLQAIEEENSLLRRALQRYAIRELRRPEPPVKNLNVGVLGLAGSGKSAFVNAMMGERFLPGITLVDTPGWDAWGRGSRQEEERLPLDAVLYLTPVPFKAQDREAFNGLQEYQKMAVLLTQIDQERDDTEAGRLILSREGKLARKLEALRKDVGAACPIIPVSSRLGLNLDVVSRLLSDWAEGILPEPDDFSHPVKDIPWPPRPREETGLFAPLLLSAREQGLRSRFLALPVGRRLVLLGLERREGLRLLSRLLHDAALEDRPFDEDDWLLAGGGEKPLPGCARLSESVEGLELLIAPSDANIRAGTVEWERLFASGWTPVIHLDLARVGTGLSDLARAPYAGALRGLNAQWVLACSQGGRFDGRLEDLALDVPERVGNFPGGGAVNFFIYENYDCRYTDFPRLGERVSPSTSNEEIETLTALWGEWGLGYHPPFTREALAAALTRVRDRLKENIEEGGLS